MAGGAVAAADIVRNIKTDALVDAAGLDRSVDGVKDSVAHVDKNAGAKERRDAAQDIKDAGKKAETAARNLGAVVRRETAGAQRLVDKIFDGRVLDILPAFDKLTKEAIELQTRSVHDLKRLLAVVQRASGDIVRVQTSIRVRIKDAEEKLVEHARDAKQNRAMISTHVSDMDGSEKIHDVSARQSGGGGVSGGAGFFESVRSILVSVVKSIISFTYYTICLVAQMAVVVALASAVVLPAYMIWELVYHPERAGVFKRVGSSLR